MTNPFAGAGAVTPGHVTVVPGGLEDVGPLILQALQASRARKERQAREAVGQIRPGTRGKDLTPQQKKAYKTATGVDIADEQEVNPIPPDEAEASIVNLERSLGIHPGSTFDVGLRTAHTARLATGQPTGPTTPAAIEAETQASADVASARAQQAKSFRTATEKVEKASGAGAAGQVPGADLSEAELAAYRQFNDFVPSEPVAQQLTGQARAEVMKQALRVAGDPNSTSWASLLPAGVKPADVIGGIALGAGSLIESGASRRNIVEATIAQEAARSLYATAEAISKDMKGAYSPTFIAAVMQGDPKALKSDAGQMVLRFTQAGFQAAFTEQAAKGDPRFTIIKNLLELARTPQIAGNPTVLAQYSNAIQSAQTAALTSSFLGYERPQEPGDQQRAWDKAFKEMSRQTVGVFKMGGGILGIGKSLQVTPPAGAVPGDSNQDPAERKRREDAQIVEQTLRALFPDSLLAPQPAKKPAPNGGPQ